MLGAPSPACPSRGVAGCGECAWEMGRTQPTSQPRCPPLSPAAHPSAPLPTRLCEQRWAGPQLSHQNPRYFFKN